MSTTSIETFRGGYFDYAEPRAEDVDVHDIARSLSTRVRFGGHVRKFYSVAEHAVYVSELVADCSSTELAYAALHHDSHEAYIGDCPSPLKPFFGEPYKQLAVVIDAAIAEALDFNVTLLSHDIVKEADAQALRVEANKLKVSRGVGEHWGQTERATGALWCWTPAQAEQRFLDHHYRYRRELGL